MKLIKLIFLTGLIVVFPPISLVLFAVDLLWWGGVSIARLPFSYWINPFSQGPDFYWSRRGSRYFREIWDSPFEWNMGYSNYSGRYFGPTSVAERPAWGLNRLSLWIGRNDTPYFLGTRGPYRLKTNAASRFLHAQGPRHGHSSAYTSPIQHAQNHCKSETTRVASRGSNITPREGPTLNGGGVGSAIAFLSSRK